MSHYPHERGSGRFFLFFVGCVLLYQSLFAWHGLSALRRLLNGQIAEVQQVSKQ